MEKKLFTRKDQKEVPELSNISVDIEERENFLNTFEGILKITLPTDVIKPYLDKIDIGDKVEFDDFHITFVENDMMLSDTLYNNPVLVDYSIFSGDTIDTYWKVDYKNSSVSLRRIDKWLS